MHPDTHIEPIFVSVAAAAAALSLNRATVYKLLDAQVIASHYQGRRRLVSVPSLREYAANLPTVPTDAA